jgi:hypothetical protein
MATNRGCKFEFTQSGDILWTPDGSVLERIQSKGLVWLPSIKNSVVIVNTILSSKHENYDTIYRRCAFIMAESIKTKSESVIVFRSFLRKIRLFGYWLHIIKIDNDSVFLGSRFSTCLCGVRHSCSEINTL